MGQGGRITKTFEYSDIGLTKGGGLTVGGHASVPDITHDSDPGKPGTVEAWFLGPKAENADLLRSLFTRAIDGIIDIRQGLYPDDPAVITDAAQTSPGYRRTAESLNTALEELLTYLGTHETPYASMRYQGHMLSDTTLPGLAGYLIGMLQNSNTATMQASTATTPLAMLVGWDICNMIGYRGDMGILPWSHLTSNGTLANLEAVWAHREAQYLPFAVRAALAAAEHDGTALAKARDLTVTTCDGQPVRICAATAWDLTNITLDEALTLPERMAAAAGLPSRFDAWNAILPHTLNSIGWPTAIARIQACRGGDALGGPPVMMVPSTKHYSWPKAAAAMGLGADRLIDVYVDANAHMDMTRLRERLDHCLVHRIPVQTVVAVVGSTQESAVDPLQDILAIREEYRLKGLDFCVHVDAAWGGYMISRIRRDFTFAGAPNQADRDPETRLHKNIDPFVAATDGIPIDDAVITNLKAMRRADSVTIDPHKWGYVQYPAGSITYRNGEIRRLTTFTGAYIGGAASVKPGEPTVGIFGLEGSRPGAAAASVFLSNRCIRPSESGHGQLIERSMINARKFTARLWCMNTKPHLPFIAIPLPRLPAERDGRPAKADIAILKDRIIGRPLLEIREDPQAMALLKAMGPDQNVVDFAFNLLTPTGRPQRSLDLFNRFNTRIYDSFHVDGTSMEPVGEQPFMMTKTVFRRETYGDAFIGTFARRLGLHTRDDDPPDALFCLRSTIMNPFLTDDGEHSMMSMLVETLEEKLLEIAGLYLDRIDPTDGPDQGRD